MADPTNYAICVPYFGGIDHEHHACMEELLKRGVTLIACYNHPYIDMARAWLITAAVEQGFDYAVFIDHDILFEWQRVPEMVQRLHEQPEDVAVMGAAYPMKNSGRMIMGYDSSVKEINAYTDEMLPAVTGGLGFNAIRLNRIRDMAKKYPPIYCPVVENDVVPLFHHTLDYEHGAYLGEDMSFYLRVKECGFRCLAWSLPRLIHKGSYHFRLEDNGMKVQSFATLKIVVDNTQDRRVGLPAPTQE